MWQVQSTKQMVYLFKCNQDGEITTYQNIQIFSTDVKSVLFYACETWKTTNQITRRLQTFINKCLRQIMNIRGCSEKISA